MPKWKADQWTAIKGADKTRMRFHIVEVIEQTFGVGNRLVSYAGRVFHSETPEPKKQVFLEIELEDFEEEKNE